MSQHERFIGYLEKQRDDLRGRIGHFESRKCEVWETTDGNRKDVTEEYVASLRSRLAEVEQMLVAEGLS